jgi:hypothetical protein
MLTGPMFASLMNVVNLRLHQVVGETREDEWTRRAASGTSMLAFTLWHVARAVDSGVNMSLRGKAELIETSPWTQRAWARTCVGVGYTNEEADEFARQVVVPEVLEYADAVRVEHRAVVEGPLAG